VNVNHLRQQGHVRDVCLGQHLRVVLIPHLSLGFLQDVPHQIAQLVVAVTQSKSGQQDLSCYLNSQILVVGQVVLEDEAELLEEERVVADVEVQDSQDAWQLGEEELRSGRLLQGAYVVLVTRVFIVNERTLLLLLLGFVGIPSQYPLLADLRVKRSDEPGESLEHGVEEPLVHGEVQAIRVDASHNHLQRVPVIDSHYALQKPQSEVVVHVSSELGQLSLLFDLYLCFCLIDLFVSYGLQEHLVMVRQLFLLLVEHIFNLINRRALLGTING
jgi:hypothetical protein